MPSTWVVVLATVFVLSGAALLAIAWASWAQKLPRNRFAGVRTSATMRSDQAFKLGNKIAAPGMAASGAVMILAAVGAAALHSPWGLGAAVVTGAAVSIIPAGYGAYVGSKAADRVPAAPESVPTCPYSAQACAGGGCGTSSEPSSKICGS
ncbi:conserved hypothetical protein [Segniliparus rotundus DSM 44985]|uniref:SdpI/YhfL protein family n=1 Tax=Segniliparus rotundus (strain ATCC BAA-972 / CDC 1076 / CIP 108378 / DSM 44985 / JCM 13578) TaxID=640132 RepID=D6ZAI8_SEGRD|nr:SdpI family protein [Segniliparus rotundus]ADG96730.1 conserved hypothetical protein [Segniliparus rotundus DSM 44985]